MTDYGKYNVQGKNFMMAHEKDALGGWWAWDDMWSTLKQYNDVHEGAFMGENSNIGDNENVGDNSKEEGDDPKEV